VSSPKREAAQLSLLQWVMYRYSPCHRCMGC